MSAPEPSTAQRLTALLDHLGIGRAHFATQMPVDVAGLAATAPDRVAGLVLVVPTRLDPEPLQGISDRVLIVAGDRGLTTEAARRALPRLAGARLEVLTDYDASGWADVAAERGDDLARAMTRFLGGLAGTPAAASQGASRVDAAGTYAGLAYTVTGAGPTLVLSPFFLAASQWDPVADALAASFTVIRIGGPHVGGVAALEDRAKAPSYRAMLRSLIDIADPRPGEPVLDVGCGSGALTRMLAGKLGAATPIDAVDVNGYLMREAQALAAAAGIADRIRFAAGSAEALPFPDRSFDCVLSVTVLEECDADKAIAEMVRVARPGARVGIVVRAIDMAQWWSMDLDPDLRARAETPPQSVSAGGVADKSLYARMRRAGLEGLVPFPALITLDRPGSTIWRYREDHVLSLLDDGERRRWRALAEAAAGAGGHFQAHALHCAVGRKAQA